MGKSELSDVVLKTKISIKRNLANYNFAISLPQNKAIEIYARVKDALLKAETILGGDFHFDFYELNRLDFATRKIFEAQGLLHENMNILQGQGLAICKACFVQINIDDHINICKIVPAYNPEEHLLPMYQLEAVLGEMLPYAFDKDLGFLTSNFDYIGTGLCLQFTCMFLFITLSEQFVKSLQKIFHRVFTLAPVLVNAQEQRFSKYVFSVFNVSTSGNTAMQLEKIFSVLKEAAVLESAERKNFLDSHYDEAHDFIHRAFLIVKNLLLITEADVLDIYAALRFGISMNFIKNMTIETLDTLLPTLRTAILADKIVHEKAISMQDITMKMIDRYRADILRKEFASVQLEEFFE